MSDLRAALEKLSDDDIDELIRKDAEYGSSWKRRGGIGAFMMLARKWDRLEQQVKANGYDIFAAAVRDQRKEGVRDDIGDLRRYLMLVETELSSLRDAAYTDNTGQTNPHGFDPALDT